MLDNYKQQVYQPVQGTMTCCPSHMHFRTADRLGCTGKFVASVRRVSSSAPGGGGERGSDRKFKLSLFQSPSSNLPHPRGRRQRERQGPTRSTLTNSPRPRRDRPSSRIPPTNRIPAPPAPPSALDPGPLSRTADERQGWRS